MVRNTRGWLGSKQSILGGSIVTIAGAQLSFFGCLVCSFKSFSRSISEAMAWQEVLLSFKICFACWISNQRWNVCHPLTVGVSCVFSRDSTVNFKSKKTEAEKGERERERERERQREVCLLSSEGQIRAHFPLWNRNKRASPGSLAREWHH